MRLRSFTPLGYRVLGVCSQNAASLFANTSLDSPDELVIVTPEVPVWKGRRQESDSTAWDAVHRAWATIQQPCGKPTMNAWRVIQTYGEDVLAGLRFFRLRDSETPSYFCLLAQEPFFQMVRRFRNLLFSIGMWWHLTLGSGLFHAAGLDREGWAYLFAGPSGAGKSTVSRLSAACGYRIIHDDHVLVSPTQPGRPLVADVVRPDLVTPLKAVFFLFQDKSNRLSPISPVVTAKWLFDSLLDSPGGPVLLGSALQSAFAISAAVARSVPGYELHFQKSPNFWDVIDAELGR